MSVAIARPAQCGWTDDAIGLAFTACAGTARD